MIGSTSPAVWMAMLAESTAPGAPEHPSALDPRGPDAHTIASVWWFLFWTALAVLLVVLTLIAVAALRGRRSSDGDLHEESRPLHVDHRTFITVGGVIVPSVILLVVAVVTVTATRDLQAAPPSPLRLEVTASQWFWQVDYPEDGVKTANEIVVPVGRPVVVGLESNDVIHSFWVPQLTGKMDVVPGNHNETHFTASTPGTYRGQCAEFCGLQHAKMAFLVRVVPTDEFDRWISARRDPPSPPTDAEAITGRQVFESQTCAGCHAIAGTAATGTVGPDLTDVGSRRTLAAGTIPNTADEMRRWIVDSQSIKPGNLMPPTKLDPADLDALVTYLESLNPEARP